MPPKIIQKARSFPRSRNDVSDDDDDELNELFKQAYESDLTNKKTIVDNKVLETCDHLDVIQEASFTLCSKCGLQLDQIEDDYDIKLDRIQFKKTHDKGISKDLEIYNLPLEIIRLADKYYTNVTNGDIKRSNLRKGIMFACVFQAYKDLGQPQTPDHLQKVFGLTRKNISKGLTYFCLGSSDKSLEIESSISITAEHFIPKIFQKFNIKSEHIDNCLQLFKQVENKSSLLNRSNPQSVSKGIVFYYLRKLNININITSYSEEVDLSITTINRICNTIDSILKPV